MSHFSNDGLQWFVCELWGLYGIRDDFPDIEKGGNKVT